MLSETARAYSERLAVKMISKAQPLVRESLMKETPDPLSAERLAEFCWNSNVGHLELDETPAPRSCA